MPHSSDKREKLHFVRWAKLLLKRKRENLLQTITVKNEVPPAVFSVLTCLPSLEGMSHCQWNRARVTQWYCSQGKNNNKKTIKQTHNLKVQKITFKITHGAEAGPFPPLLHLLKSGMLKVGHSVLKNQVQFSPKRKGSTDTHTCLLNFESHKDK